MWRILRPSLLCVALIASAGSSGHAAFLTVANYSFENPARANGGFTAGPSSVPGWTGAPSAGIELGVENPFASRYAQTADVIDDPDAHGKQYGYINTFANSEVGSLTSDVIALISPNTRYTLTVALGNGLNIHPSLYTIQLLANGSAVASSNVVGTTIAAGTFHPFSTSFETPAVGAILNQQLRIRLIQTNVTGIAFSPVQGHYDNVRLEAVSTPEPASMALLAVGSGLLAFGRRKLRPLDGKREGA